jgi:hypothetical protein
MKMAKAAAAAKDRETGTCANCEVDNVVLVGVSEKAGGKVCDACFTKIRQNGLAFDQYELQPGEMLAEHVADKIENSKRNVLNHIKSGKLKATLQTKRVHNKLQEVLIIMADDVEKFLEERDRPKQKPVVDRTPETAMAAPAQGEALMNGLAYIAEMVRSVKEDSSRLALPPAQEEAKTPRDQFIETEVAIAEYGLSKADLNNLAGEGLLRKFTGPKGKRKWSRRQIENL